MLWVRIYIFFWILTHYWDVLGFVMFEFVMDFQLFMQGVLVYILILKNNNHVLIKDYQPIRLIWLQYKIIIKLLANILVEVVHDIVRV